MNILVKEFDLEKYVVGRGGVAETKSKGEYRMDCQNPRCPNPKMHLAVNTKNEKWRCFVCGRGYKGRVNGAQALISFLENISWNEALHTILEEVGVARRHSLEYLDVNLDIRVSSHEKRWESYPLPEGFRGLYGCRVPYLDERRVSDDVINRMRIGMAKNWIIFPIYNELGELIYWQGRNMNKPVWGLKYKKSNNPPRKAGSDGFYRHAGPSDVVLNLDHACTFPIVRVVEGPFDCAQAGPNAVSILGKNLSPAQTGILLERGVEHIELMLDPGEHYSRCGTPKERYEAKKQRELIQSTAQTLAALFRRVDVVQIPYGTDPGDWNPEQNGRFPRAQYKGRLSMALAHL